MLLALALFLATVNMAAQDTAPAHARHKYYCEVIGKEKELGTGLKIVVDFGKDPTYNIWGGLKNDQKLVDEQGKEIKFKSMVDAANFMEGKGWTFLQAYGSVYEGAFISHWIFRKEAATPEEARQGLRTKGEVKKQANPGQPDND